MRYYYKKNIFFAAVSAMVLWACESSSASKPEAEEADVEIIRFDASEVQTDSLVDYRDDHKYEDQPYKCPLPGLHIAQ